MAGQHQYLMMQWKQSCCSATGTPSMPSAVQGIRRGTAKALVGRRLHQCWVASCGPWSTEGVYGAQSHQWLARALLQ